MTTDEKLAYYDQIVAFIEDQRELEAYQYAHNLPYDDIQLGRTDAYRHIVRLVTGIDIFRHTREPDKIAS